jgi:hypothetical protein
VSDTLAPVRRTHVVRHRPEYLAVLLRDYAAAGRLVTRPRDIPIRYFQDGTAVVAFELLEPSPERIGPFARLWALPATRLALCGLVVLLVAYAGGWIVGALSSGPLIALAKAALPYVLTGLAVAMVALLAVSRRGCACPGIHCAGCPNR